ncbi:MAG: helicase-related protein, partial [Gemmatimonadales bacterium]
PGVVLADEVGMGKTFVALAAVYAVARQAKSGPVVIMVPANLVDKWIQDLRSFCQLYTPGVEAVPKELDGDLQKRAPDRLLFGVARHSVEFMRLLDDPLQARCQLILLAQGAMSRQQSDKWVRLAFIAEAFRRHGRRAGLSRVKRTAHRFLGELLEALGEQRVHESDEGIWEELIRLHPDKWKDRYNGGVRSVGRQLTDDPVPKALIRSMQHLDLDVMARALELLPIRARGDSGRMDERIRAARDEIRKSEGVLWRQALARANWRSPLLVLDEAHHLKNPKTTLAQMFQEFDEEGSRRGAGAIHSKFDRMCFLTATPFQLGHRELVNVLRRFGGVRWDRAALGEHKDFEQRIDDLAGALDHTQRTSMHFQRTWRRLGPDDAELLDQWVELCERPREALEAQLRAALDAFDKARESRHVAQETLRPWIIRHNKGTHWDGGEILRRIRQEGERMLHHDGDGGLRVPGDQVVPFFLAARSAVLTDKDLLGEALASSYEAFRHTRRTNRVQRDDQEESVAAAESLGLSRWYRDQFDRVLEDRKGRHHPKIDATVRRAADLWEKSEKVLVFAFYRKTCQALRFHIAREIEDRIYQRAAARLGTGDHPASKQNVEAFLERIQSRFFDDVRGRGRVELDRELERLLWQYRTASGVAPLEAEYWELLLVVMRRFLRVPSTLLRSFPLEEVDRMPPAEAVNYLLGHRDASGLSRYEKLERFLRLLFIESSAEERKNYLDALGRMDTGGIRVDAEEGYDVAESDQGAVVLANVRVATGATKRQDRLQLMRGFNTPFFPEVFVCSEVMGEGVDLHRACRHVIHHDLAWNPSQLEQRTGRIDRLGCKAEGRHPIVVDMPFLAGMTDERQYKVMTDREEWFRVVMGQKEVADLVPEDGPALIPLPEAAAAQLGFRLGL